MKASVVEAAAKRKVRPAMNFIVTQKTSIDGRVWRYCAEMTIMEGFRFLDTDANTVRHNHKISANESAVQYVRCPLMSS